MYGASIFGEIIINISKSINKENQIFWRLQYIARFDVPSVLPYVDISIWSYPYAGNIIFTYSIVYNLSNVIYATYYQK